MDTSETRIKMCEKAREIREGWKPESGDFVWRRYTVFGEEIDSQIWQEEQRADISILIQKSQVGTYWSATDKDGNERIFDSAEDLTKCTCLWLPRQDQLQEMVGIRTPEDFGKFYGQFCFPWEGEFGIPEYMKHCESMEQLWLAFVMKEKYNKVWDGEDWVKSEVLVGK